MKIKSRPEEQKERVFTCIVCCQKLYLEIIFPHNYIYLTTSVGSFLFCTPNIKLHKLLHFI